MIDETQVRKIAHLARLTLSDAEVGTFAAQLSGILEFAESLNAVDVTGIKPTAHAVEVSNVFREDEARDASVIARSLENAPKTEDGFFLVPKVL